MMSQKNSKQPLKQGSKKPRHKLKTLTKFVIFSFSCLIAYTIASQVIAVISPGTDLSTLTTCFFASFGGEVLICAIMKMLKLKGTINGNGINSIGDMQCDDLLNHGSDQEDS